MAEQSPDSPVRAEIAWPTKEEIEQGVAQVQRYSPVWIATPALLVIKPHLGLIVSVKQIEYDDRFLTLKLALDQTIVAPEEFRAQDPIQLQCVWNQPYLHLARNSIFAPYCFSLHFGVEGVQHVRSLTATGAFEDRESSGMMLGLLRRCFDPGYQPPAQY